MLSFVLSSNIQGMSTLVLKMNEKELNKKILDTTMRICQDYPELSKYLDEMPETIPNEKRPIIGIRSLIDYYESLVTLIDNYALTHPTT